MREYLPGTVWETEDGLETDMDVVYDANDDIPALWGFGETAANYEGDETPYSGDIWKLSSGETIITIDNWN